MKYLVRLFEDFNDKVVAQLIFNEQFIPRVNDTIWVYKDDCEAGTPYKVLAIEYGYFMPREEGKKLEEYQFEEDEMTIDCLVEINYKRLDELDFGDCE